MLELQNIDKTFKGKKALDGINFVVPEGASHAIIGSSGSGKTTLLRVTLGLIPFDRGYVKINGQELRSYTHSEWAEKIGYVPQDGGLFPHLSALKNVTLVAELRKWNRSRITQRLEELSSIADLESSILERFPSELSGGQQQRVAIMRAAFMDPPVLLLDEPMAALDPLLRRNLQEELKSIFQRLKKTVVIVTHDLGEAAFIADKISLMKDGRIIQTGTYEDLLRNPTDPFVTYFINAQRTLPSIEKACQ